jgi:hypothetical protein
MGEDYSKPRVDLSFFILIVSNLITIIFALKDNWNFFELLLVFWAQSIIIGIFNFARIITLKKFSTENFKINHKSVNTTKATRNLTAFFFLINYGFFHFGYFLFLLRGNIINNQINIIGILFIIGVFFVNHLFSFIFNYKRDSEKVKNIGTVLVFPYARIIPMHTVMIFGMFLANNQTGLLFFLILKTIADVIMHQIEHNDFATVQTNKTFKKFAEKTVSKI